MKKSNIGIKAKIGGKFATFETKFGKRYSGRIVNETPCYVSFYDLNGKRTIKVSKNTLTQVRSGSLVFN